jgi:hypothetical protein
MPSRWKRAMTAPMIPTRGTQKYLAVRIGVIGGLDEVHRDEEERRHKRNAAGGQVRDSVHVPGRAGRNGRRSQGSDWFWEGGAPGPLGRALT